MAANTSTANDTNAATVFNSFGKDPIAVEFQKQMLDLMRNGSPEDKSKALEMGMMVYVAQQQQPSLMEKLILHSFGLNFGGRH